MMGYGATKHLVSQCDFRANTENSTNAVSMLADRIRRWPSIETALGESPVFAELGHEFFKCRLTLDVVNSIMLFFLRVALAAARSSLRLTSFKSCDKNNTRLTLQG